MAKKVTRIGRYRVEDATRIYTPGEELTTREIAGYQRRAVRTILRDVRDVEPEVLKYARGTLGLTQTQLGRMLGVRKETVCRWETGAEVFPEHVPLALSALVDMAERGVDFEELFERVIPSEGTITLKAG